MNSNFPTHLSITASQLPSEFRRFVVGSDESLPIRPDEDHIFNQDAAISRYGIAGRIWEAAYLFDMYLRAPVELEFHPHPFTTAESPSTPGCPNSSLTVLELGSGTGFAGFAVAKRLAHACESSITENHVVIVTDLPDVCPLLEENWSKELAISYHDAQRVCAVHVRPLTWSNIEHMDRIAAELHLTVGFSDSVCEPRHLTHIICSDLIYFPELLAPLLRTLIHLSGHPFVSSPGSVEIIISYKVRSLPKETPFWSAFGLWFAFEPVVVRSKAGGPWSRFGSGFDGPSFLFVAHRKLESLKWSIPAQNEDLMDGVGALGTDVRKVDDTFEMLLLMGMENEVDDIQ